jgi:protein-tyrosine-phosphatase
MAATLADIIFASRGIAAVASSCGIFAAPDAEASENAVLAMKNGWDADVSGHKARMTDEANLADAHIVITMTMGHKSHLLAMYPNFADKIHAIKELCKDGCDIDDPFGASLDVYQKCAKQIEGFLEKFDWEEYL